MRAVRYHEYGDPAVLTVEDDVPEPHAGPGQIRIATRAAGINPFDWKVRSGIYQSFMPVQFPANPGSEAAGVVDEVGEGVDSVVIGDEVFGLAGTGGGYGEYVVLTKWAKKPEALTWEQAAGAGVAVETATRVLDELGVGEGTTLLIDGAAGGVGTAAVQIAKARGAQVVGTASETNHALLRRLGAAPVTYGEGLPERVAAITPAPIDAVFDAVGKNSLEELITIAGSPDKVITIAHPEAAAYGVASSAGADAPGAYGLGVVANLATEGTFTVPVHATFAFKDAPEAHEVSEAGHLAGKLILVPG